jgi:hypothetical protein
MLTSNLIKINIIFMDMKRHMLIFLKKSIGGYLKEKWDSYKMEVVITKGGR